MIDPARYITNALRDLYQAKNTYTKYRILGNIEAALCFKGVFSPGEPFHYKQVIGKNWIWGRKLRMETYAEMIVRHAEEEQENPTGFAKLNKMVKAHQNCEEK